MTITIAGFPPCSPGSACCRQRDLRSRRPIPRGRSRSSCRSRPAAAPAPRRRRRQDGRDARPADRDRQSRRRRRHRGDARGRKSPPDGYTLLVVTSATVGTSPSLFQNLGYDPRKDFAPIGLIAGTPNLIVVHPSFPARSLAELIKIGKETAAPIPTGRPAPARSTISRSSSWPTARHEALARGVQGRGPRSTICSAAISAC